MSAEQKSPLTGLIVAGLVVFGVFGINRYLVNRAAPAGDSVANAVNQMEPSAAGTERALTALRNELDGKTVVGQVGDIYVELAPNFYLSIERAPSHLRKTARRFVDVEFPDALSKSLDTASLIVRASDTEVQKGDVVEVKFVEGFGAVGTEGITRVTQVVAPRDTDLAKSFAQRIAARKATGKAVAMGDASPAHEVR